MKKSMRLTALLLCLALLLSACGKGDEPETLRRSGFRTVPIRVSAKYANAGDVKLKNYAAELLGWPAVTQNSMDRGAAGRR